jgi:pimeloyl-ACP methyl ester carboxylesterase
VGGGIGQIFAVHHPDLLYDLTLINSIAYDYWPVQPITAMRTPIIRQLIMAMLNKGSLKLIVQRGVYNKDRVDDELMELFWEPMQSSAGRKAFLHFAKCLNNQNLTTIENDLRKLDLPVLIIRGDADVYLSSAISEKLDSEIPHSYLKRILTGGHFIQEDEPEKPVEIIAEFYRKT